MKTQGVNRRGFLGMAAGAAMLAAVPAGAFRPSARWIADQMASARLKMAIRGLRVQGQGRSLDASGRMVPSAETWVFGAPHNAVVRVAGAGVASVRVRNARQDASLREGGAVVKAARRADVLLDFFSSGPGIDRGRLTTRFETGIRQLGVNTKKIGLSRVDGRIAWVIGGRGWDDSVSRVFIDKETGQLLRVFHVRKDGEVTHTSDVVLTGYGSAVTGAWFPERVRWFEDGKLTREMRASSVEKNPTHAADAFELSQLAL